MLEKIKLLVEWLFDQFILPFLPVGKHRDNGEEDGHKKNCSRSDRCPGEGECK